MWHAVSLKTLDKRQHGIVSSTEKQNLKTSRLIYYTIICHACRFSSGLQEKTRRNCESLFLVILSLV